MQVTVKQMQNIIELSKEDWDIHYVDHGGYEITNLPVHKLVLASEKTLLVHTDISTEIINFSGGNVYVEAELNTFRIYDADMSNRLLIIENYIPYKTELLALFKLLGQSSVMIIEGYSVTDSRASTGNHYTVTIDKLLKQEWKNIDRIENPIYPYAERKRIFNKK